MAYPTEQPKETPKREEIYATAYHDLDHLQTNLGSFIDEYYDGTRLHSALGYPPPNKFERGLASRSPSGAARMQFFRSAQKLKPGDGPWSKKRQ